MEATERLDVSVILPVYNESAHLEEEVIRIRKSLDASDYSYEVLIVDDGSTDGSGELAENLEGVRVLRFSTNRGAGGSRDSARPVHFRRDLPKSGARKARTDLGPICGTSRSALRVHS